MLVKYEPFMPPSDDQLTIEPAVPVSSITLIACFTP